MRPRGARLQPVSRQEYISDLSFHNPRALYAHSNSQPTKTIFESANPMSTLAELQTQIRVLERQAAEIRKRDFDATVQEIRATMQAFGITTKDLHIQAVHTTPKKHPAKPKSTTRPMARGPSKTKVPVAAKYRGPSGETWSGRGRTPRWLAAEDGLGRAREEFRIASYNPDPTRTLPLSLHNEAS